MTTDPALAALGEIGDRRRAVDTAELQAITAARTARYTWAQIAEALGLGSAQAAHYRHQALLRRPTGGAAG